MKDRFSVDVLLSRDVGDRILLGLFSPIIMALTGGLACAAYSFSAGRDVVLQVAVLVIGDFSFVFFCFATFVFIWACFAPVWLERILATTARRVMLTAAFFLTGAVLAAICYLL